MFKALGSVFSKLGKSAAFKGTLAAIGTVAAGEIGARLAGIGASRGYQPTPEAQAAASQSGGMGAGFGFGQQIPWGPILLVLAIGGGVYLFTRGR